MQKKINEFSPHEEIGDSLGPMGKPRTFGQDSQSEK
jgi:hypothetical protein